MPSDTLAITIPPDTAAVPRLLDAIEAWSEGAALPPALAHRLGVVLEELAANVAMHGSGGPDGATFVAVTIARAPGRLVATVEDDGRPFDPLARAAPDIEAALEERDVGGLGVHFARVMTRELHYVRDGGRNRVTAIFDAG